MNMERFFTADTHFGHTKLLTLQPRPFDTIEDMNEDLIRRWNGVVKPGDIVYHLGDFGIRMGQDEAKKIFRRLNGQKFLILGNHDEKNQDVLRLKWQWQGHMKTLKLDGQKIFLCHYPMQCWDGSMRASWHLYGHVHGKLPEHATCLKIDVGVDSCILGVPLWRPLSFGEVREVMSKRQFVPPDRRKVFYEEDL